MDYRNLRLEKMEISVDEKMDAARYKCTIYHYCTAFDEYTYLDFSSYEQGVSVGKPSFGYLKDEGDCMIGIVYVFRNNKMLKLFISENPHLVKLHTRTKNKKVLT